MEAFTKIVRIGKQHPSWSPYPFSTFIKVVFDGARLSMTGVEGPQANGNCHGSCGQINMHEWAISAYAPGIDAATVKRIREVWEAWHLNDMQAGSPRQMAHLAANPVEWTYPESHYVKACEALTAAGINPDQDHLLNGKPYRYGSAWLTVAVPDDVLAFLRSLPDTDIQPAWV